MPRMPDTVKVRIPATTTHVALLRAAASALAARLDFPVDRITELQIAVDEVCSRLMAVSEEPSFIRMEFVVEMDKSIRILAEVDGSRREDRDLLSEWSRVILEAIARDIAPDLSNGRIGLSLRVARAVR
jgi:serine/threonine-protein kinase RsbW